MNDREQSEAEAVTVRKRPVEVEAIQYNGSPHSHQLCCAWVAHRGGWAWRAEGGKIAIRTLEGVVTASPNDWIIMGVRGEFYPCKPDIFEATYERI